MNRRGSDSGMGFDTQSLCREGEPARVADMTEQERAAENLKVIRSLMERATIYRALSWPTALFGGVVAVILSVLLYFREEVAMRGGDAEVVLMTEAAWVFCWLVALVGTGAFNAILIGRKAAREKGPFFSPGLKMALRMLVPPMLVGGVLGVGHVLSAAGTAAGTAAIWTMCYGIALLATTGIAPRSIRWLGWFFLAAGVAVYLFVWSDGAHPRPGVGAPDHLESPMLEANLIMGACFGGFHLIYAVVVMLMSRKDHRPEADGND